MAKTRDITPLLDVRQNQLGFLLGVSDAIDTKALAVLASNVAILIFVAQADLALRWWGYAFSLAPYVVALLLTVVAVWPREYSGAGVNLSDHPEYLNLPEQALLLQLLADTQQAILVNKALNAWRLWLLIAAMLATGLVTIVLFVILIV